MFYKLATEDVRLLDQNVTLGFALDGSDTALWRLKMMMAQVDFAERQFGKGLEMLQSFEYVELHFDAETVYVIGQAIVEYQKRKKESCERYRAAVCEHENVNHEGQCSNYGDWL